MRVSTGASVLTLDDRGHGCGVQCAQRHGRKPIASPSWEFSATASGETPTLCIDCIPERGRMGSVAE